MKRVFSVAAVLLAALMLFGSYDSAEARRGGGGFRGGGGHVHAFRGGGVRFYGGPRFVRRGAYFAAPLAVYGGYRYYGGGGCYWLRERAMATGSRYWWSRYHACRNGYPY